MIMRNGVSEAARLLERFVLDVNRNSHRVILRVAQISFECSVGSGGAMRWGRTTQEAATVARRWGGSVECQSRLADGRPKLYSLALHAELGAMSQLSSTTTT
jgi:hypothetical protein